MTNYESSRIPNADTISAETDLVSLIKKMQQQLNFLEKKIDILIGQSQGKPFRDGSLADKSFQKRPYSKSARPFNRPHAHNREKREQRSGDRETARTHFYERFKSAKKRGTNPKRKPHISQSEDGQ